MIQGPFVLSELPKPLPGSKSKVLAADVYGVGQTRKRKRSELAVAIDGEGINLYDVDEDVIFTLSMLAYSQPGPSLQVDHWLLSLLPILLHLPAPLNSQKSSRSRLCATPNLLLCKRSQTKHTMLRGDFGQQLGAWGPDIYHCFGD